MQRTGPVLLRDCFHCDGAGYLTCLTCFGTGKIIVDIHPFGTLESAVEQLQTAVRHPTPERINGAIDTLQSLFQQLVLLLPEEYDRTENHS